MTVTVGGNDVNFAPVLTECAKPSWWGNCTKAINDALVILRTQLPARLTGLYAAIRAQAPYARVVVTGYPLLFNGSDCSLLTFFSSSEEAALNAATNELDGLLQARAAAAGFVFVDPRPAFVGHAWCDRQEWINGLSNPILESYHPNVSGHAAYATWSARRWCPAALSPAQVSISPVPVSRRWPRPPSSPPIWPARKRRRREVGRGEPLGVGRVAAGPAARRTRRPCCTRSTSRSAPGWAVV